MREGDIGLQRVWMRDIIIGCEGWSGIKGLRE